MISNAFNLSNIIDFPTRNNSYLDKIFTNDASYINAECCKAAPLGNSDHVSILITNAVLLKSDFCSIYKHVVTSTAKRNIQIDIARIDWSPLLAIRNLDVKAEAYQKTISDIFNLHCPIKRFRMKNSSHPAWETPIIQKLRRAKDRAFRQGKSSYIYLKKTLDIFICKAKKEHYNNKVNNLKAGRATWWQNIKAIENNTTAKAPAHYILDDKLCDPQQFVNKLNAYYASIAEPMSHQNSNIDSSDKEYDLDPVSIGEVKKHLKSINSTKSVSSEDYPPWITKMCCEDLCVPITNIVNQSLREAKFPSIYKHAEITPVAKHTSPASCKDYRPISLLWNVGKVLEHFINKKLRSALIPKLHINQFAYMDKVGCTDALVALLSDITKILDNNRNAGAQIILYDFSKAFDMMQHPLLINKLHSLEVPTHLINLVGDYLKNRQQSVNLKQQKVRSPTASSCVGVPQGTLLGPTLWLAFVDSLQFSSGGAVKYADDTTSYIALPKKNLNIQLNTAQATTFTPPIIGQQLIDECHQWSMDNGMQLNASKTKVMNISLRKKLTMTANYQVDRTHNVEMVQQSRLLGVHIDCHLNFDHHIESIKQSASKKCYGLLILKRAGVNCDSLVMLYKAQVRPAIMHSAAAWYPYTTLQHHKTIEAIQKLALRIIYPNIYHYSERLSVAKILSLCDTLDNTCKSYANKVRNDTTHPLHTHVPMRPSQIRTSNRLNSGFIYLTRNRTAKCDKNVLRNPIYISS
jgi:hypothetical protein